MSKIMILGTISFLLQFSCSHQQKEFKQTLKTGQCSKAWEKLPENDSDYKIVGKTKQGTKTLLSYALTGAGYATDVTVFLVTNVGVLVAICLPIASMGSSCTGIEGFPGVPMLTNLGEKTHQSTKKWRCPNLEKVSRSIRQVANCYQTSGEVEKAKRSLRSITYSEEFKKCLSREEKDRVYSQLNQI